MSDLRARLAEVLAMPVTGPLIRTLQTIDAKEAFLRSDALARALEDAERYLWLRDHAQTTDFSLPRWTVAREESCIGQTYRGAELDTAIDAARSK